MSVQLFVGWIFSAIHETTPSGPTCVHSSSVWINYGFWAYPYERQRRELQGATHALIEEWVYNLLILSAVLVFRF